MGLGVLQMDLTNEEKKILKKIAIESIQYGLEKERYLLPKQENLTPNLMQKGASFVTLHKKSNQFLTLRGCIGSVFPKEALAIDVAKNAYYAAFSDPRFPKLTMEDFPFVELKISVLNPLVKIHPKSFEELLQILRPYLDGLYLKCSHTTATFLPDVWSKVEDAKEFVKELYQKADLELEYPFSKIEWYTYTTINF